jgi:serine/threonine protein kinase
VGLASGKSIIVTMFHCTDVPKEKLSESDTRSVIHQLLNILDTLHSLGIVYGYINCASLSLSDDTDFASVTLSDYCNAFMENSPDALAHAFDAGDNATISISAKAPEYFTRLPATKAM